MRNEPNIKGLEIYYCYLADGTAFFLQNKNSIFYLLEKFKLYFLCSELKPNIAKCEITGIGIGLVKGVQVAVCCTRCIDLRREAVKILGIYFYKFL